MCDRLHRVLFTASNFVQTNRQYLHAVAGVGLGLNIYLAFAKEGQEIKSCKVAKCGLVYTTFLVYYNFVWAVFGYNFKMFSCALKHCVKHL